MREGCEIDGVFVEFRIEGAFWPRGDCQIGFGIRDIEKMGGCDWTLSGISDYSGSELDSENVGFRFGCNYLIFHLVSIMTMNVIDSYSAATSCTVKVTELPYQPSSQ